MKRDIDRQRDDTDNVGQRGRRRPKPVDDDLDDELIARYGRAAFARDIADRRRR